MPTVGCVPQINPGLPIVGQPDSTEEPKVVTALSQLIAAVNGVDSAQIADGAIQPADLQSTLLDALGVTAGGTVRRGKSIVATTESRTSAAYGLMPTPDRVSGIVLPTDGLIAIGYQATWQASAPASPATAAIFLGANQLKLVGTGNGAPSVQEATLNGAGAATDVALGTTPYGLQRGTALYSGDVTTGQILGLGANGNFTPTDNVPGLVWAWAAAGTYDVTVQFKSGSGSVTVKNRRLWVTTLGF